MSKSKKISVVCYSISTAAILAIAVFAVLIFSGRISGFEYIANGISFGFYSSNGVNIKRFENLTGDYKQVGSYTVGAEDLKSLDVDWVAGDIEIISGEGSEIILTEYVQREITDDEQVGYRTENGYLKVRYTQAFFGAEGNRTIDSMPCKKLVIQIPQSMSQDMDDIMVDNTDGDVNLSGFSGNTCTVDSTSGDIVTEDLTFLGYTASSTSGNVSGTNINSDGLSVEVYSGSIALENVTGKQMYADSSSGDIQLNNVEAETISVSSYSGGISVNGLKADDVTVDMTSGETSMEDVTAKKLSLSAYSGDIELSGVSSHSLFIDCTSGEVTVSAGSIAGSEIETYSGSMHLEGSFEKMTLNSTSGDISVKSEVCPYKFSVDTSSGSVKLTIPMTDDIGVEFESLSGEFDSGDFKVSGRAGSSKHSFYVNTTSGNFVLDTL